MTKHSTEKSSLADNAPMEQVRDLLFGNQLKDMDLRFKRQEERFQRELADLRDAMKNRMESLENFMKSESASLLHRIREDKDEQENALRAEQRDRVEAVKSEQRERAEALKAEQRERSEGLAQAAKDLAAAVETFDRKLAKITNALDTAERDLRQLLLAESTKLGAKIEERYQGALDVLASTSAQIRHDMVHRSALSGMFTEVAVKLSGQWPMDVEHTARNGQEDAWPGEEPGNAEDA